MQVNGEDEGRRCRDPAGSQVSQPLEVTCSSPVLCISCVPYIVSDPHSLAFHVLLGRVTEDRGCERKRQC